jgi:hypothetical protein
MSWEDENCQEKGQECQVVEAAGSAVWGYRADVGLLRSSGVRESTEEALSLGSAWP